MSHCSFVERGKVQIQIAIACLVCYDIFKLERIGHFFSIFTIESLLLYLLDLDHLVQVYIHIKLNHGRAGQYCKFVDAKFEYTRDYEVKCTHTSRDIYADLLYMLL